MLPWSELEGLHKEADEIRPRLVQLCRHGYLTINSQPQVNSAPSTDPAVGWGGPGGWAFLSFPAISGFLGLRYLTSNMMCDWISLAEVVSL